MDYDLGKRLEAIEQALQFIAERVQFVYEKIELNSRRGSDGRFKKPVPQPTQQQAQQVQRSPLEQQQPEESTEEQTPPPVPLWRGQPARTAPDPKWGKQQAERGAEQRVYPVDEEEDERQLFKDDDEEEL